MTFNVEREEAVALIRRARVERDAGRLSEARALQAEAVSRLRAVGDPAPLAHALRHLADLDTAARDKRATSEYEEALALYRSAPDAPDLDVANAVRAQAVHLESIGRLADARKLWQEARARYAVLGPRFEQLLGRAENPGLTEATERLRLLET